MGEVKGHRRNQHLLLAGSYYSYGKSRSSGISGKQPKYGSTRAYPVWSSLFNHHVPFSLYHRRPVIFRAMMNSIILRRVAARSVARHRSLTPTNILRSYSTSSEEPDPQLDGYPQLPWQSRQNLPPLGWQDNLTRRNFGDTVRLSRLDLFFQLLTP